MFSKELVAKANQTMKSLQKNRLRFAVAESCTAGLVTALFTEIPGASAVLERGIVCYSNDSKVELLTVPTFFLEAYGAVSRETAIAMAEGMLLNSKADVAISVTGIAGPDGGTKEKPVGTVYFGLAQKSMPTVYEHRVFNGSRNTIRLQAVEMAVDMLLRHR